ncbi:hypothetical protein MKX01_008466 [Papaver californicum]|nr:hypothetical protein MKX01_008466 [Papaver californicum]
MEYNKIFARSFSHYEQEKIGYWAIGVCLVIAILTSFTVISKPSYLTTSLPILKYPMLNLIRINHQSLQESNTHVDICEIDGHIRIHGKSSSVLYSSSSAEGISSTGNESWIFKQYARKTDNSAMKAVNDFLVKPLLKNELNQPNCTTYHTVPAVVFSVGGYAGNHYHAYNDVLVPLFLTSHQFNQQVQFLVTDFNPYWISKYKPILNHLSKYPILEVDKQNDVHCYPRVIVGLKFHKDLRSSEISKTSLLNRSSPIIMRGNIHSNKLPRLLIVSSKRTQFTNKDEIAKMATSMAYEVIVISISMCVCELRNWNGVFVQIIPWGGLEWVFRVSFEEPAKDMILKYLEYKITEIESSLIQQYPLDHAVGTHLIRSVFLGNQDVNIDVERFRPTLLKALELLRM